MAKDSGRRVDKSERVVGCESDQRDPREVESGCAELTVEQILAWADAHHAAHGAWPAVGPGTVTGPVPGAPRESWKAINHALALGLRGLPGDSSLAELLAEHRGAPLPDMGPKALAEKIWAWEQEHFPVKGPRKRLRSMGGYAVRVTIAEILAWADAHHAATGKWPNTRSGLVRAASHEVPWSAINMALIQGHRGLPGGTTLARLLAEHRDFKPPLTVERILAWADAFHAAHGRWPGTHPKSPAPAPNETWRGIDQALRLGHRGLPGGTSLVRLLVATRGPEASHQPLRVTIEQILAWADAHHAATGGWPICSSGAVAGVPGLTWAKIEAAVRLGLRGLKCGTTLARLLAKHRGYRNPLQLSGLTVEGILAWADAHHEATGNWPSHRSGLVRAASHEEHWSAINQALVQGHRGLTGGTSLARLLAEHLAGRPALTVDRILALADAYHAAHGHWPCNEYKPGAAAPGETWKAINRALKVGWRGLPGGTSLTHLLVAHRGPEASPRPPRLTVEQILAWADAHRAATGRWPKVAPYPVAGSSSGDTWRTIDQALRTGLRGLPEGTSLAGLLARHRTVSNQRVDRSS